MLKVEELMWILKTNVGQKDKLYVNTCNISWRKIGFDQYNRLIHHDSLN